MSDRSVNIIETRPHETYKYCIVGVPDVGLVGSIALGYAIQHQQMEETGYIDSPQFPPVIVVHNGEPKPPFRLYSQGEIVMIISEIPIEAQMISETAQTIIEWAKTKKVQLLIAVSGIAVPNRLEIDKAEVYGVGSTQAVDQILSEHKVKRLDEGFITGLHAVLMKASQRAALPCTIMLAQSHLQYPDPGAAASIIRTLKRFIGIDVDPTELFEQEEEIRVKMRALMQRTQQQMRQIQKGHEQELPMFV